MAQTLQTLSVISFVGAAIFFILAVLFWFVFKIPTVISDLSGRTARKSIAKIRATNQKNSAKANLQNKKPATKTQADTKKPAAKTQAQANTKKPVAKTQAQTVAKKSVPMTQAAVKQKPAAPKMASPETAILTENKAGGADTVVTGVLNQADDNLEAATTTLLVDEYETAPLYTPSEMFPVRECSIKLEMIEEIMLIHTDEVI